MNQLITELMPELFSKSELMILDFKDIHQNLPEYKNIQSFFEKSNQIGINPRLPENRQAFNDSFLEKCGKRYLIGRYAEDRSAMLKGSRIEKEGRTIHLGIDIFSKNLEIVCAPCDSEIIFVGCEEGSHTFGYYMILKPSFEVTDKYIFLGHLSKDMAGLGNVKKGQIIAKLGDFIDEENGGWSRHLHVQLLKDLPINNLVPIGYSTKEDLGENIIKYPDPSFIVFNKTI